MTSPGRLVRIFLREECGQDLLEYALIAALIALACIGTMRSLSSSVAVLFSKVGSTLTSST